uniref:UPAR/Ly6 domain-containing protein n=1 Tax=Trichobilharzia regenti TaxID=157069 RepID=A0AA85JVC6_TRIRE|nr:unnamed protein product [Trichobilharzia regenti]
MLAVLVFFSLLSNLEVVSGANLTCYTCKDCEQIDKDTERTSGCGSCLKSISYSPDRHVMRSCELLCELIQPLEGVEFYCCETDLCNSTAKVNKNRLFIFSVLFVLMINNIISYLINVYESY